MTSTDDTDATSSISLVFSLGTRITPSAFELLRSGRKNKKVCKLLLASQKFKAGIKAALKCIYPRSLMRPKGILYRLTGKQKHRFFAESFERQT